MKTNRRPVSSGEPTRARSGGQTTDEQSSHGQLDRIEIYVRQHFRDLTMAEHAIYFDALRVLERKGNGIFKPIAKAEDVWASESGATRPTVRKTLRSLLQRGLLTHKPGNNGRDGERRKVSVVRRCTVEQIKEDVAPETLHRFVPEDFDALAGEWNNRSIPWNGTTIKPRWGVTITGRLKYSGSPLTGNRTNTEGYRLKAFRKSLKSGELLLEADWVAAEPTVLVHALVTKGYLLKPIAPSSIYGAIAQHSGKKRKEAKRLFNKLIYGPNQTVVIPSEWRLPKEHFLHEFIRAVNKYRDLLWKTGQPCAGHPRHVHTLTGRKMELPRGQRPHKGKMFAWHLQGTVADLFAPAVRQILNDERKGLCRFFFPNHDGVFVAVHDAHYDPATILEQHAENAGIPMEAVVKEEAWEPLIDS